MTTVQFLFNVFLHLDKYLGVFMNHYGALAYVMIFLVIFCETGLVVTPFLPGDSLIFASGALAAKHIMAGETVILLCAAAIAGNMVNYEIGRFLSDRVRSRQKMRFIKQENIDRTQKFFEKYGGLTIIITRFMPIIRTFTPFVAGVGYMKRPRFWAYNAMGGILWACSFFGIGYFFGNLPFVKNHFSFIVVAIVLVSVLPAVIAFLKAHSSSKKSTKRD